MVLTVDEFREHVSTSLGDDAVQRLLDAAEAEIVRYAGEPSSVSEIVDGRGRYLVLSRPADAITSIVETWWDTDTTLIADDYLVRSPYVLERLRTGTSPHRDWWGRVTVTYLPADDEAIRIGVLLDLMQLVLNYNPGAASERIGAWEETFRTTLEANKAEKSEILSRLDIGPSLVIV
jgi:hypothetical protein